MPEPRRVLVTGAGGAIGGAVARALLARGFAVSASVGPPGEAPRRAPPRGARAAAVDVRDRAGLAALAEGAFACVHVAGPPGVAHSFLDPEVHRLVHVEGTRAVADVAAGAGLRRLVYVSSAEVYPAGVVDEDATPDPRSPYAACKLDAERLLRARCDDLEVAVVRPFLVADDLPPRGVFAAIARQLADPWVALSDPDVVKDLVWVHDVASLLARAATVPLLERFRIFNAGTGVGTRLGDLAGTLHRRFGGSGEVRTRPQPDRPMAALPVLVADTSRARAELGWAPTVLGAALVDRVATQLGVTA